VVLGFFDEGDEGLEVVVDAEMFEGEVVGSFVVGVRAASEVVGADGHAAEGKVGARVGREEFLEDGVLLVGGEGVEGGPTEFVEAAAKAFDGGGGVVGAG
jgi:hypothetical protein